MAKTTHNCRSYLRFCLSSKAFKSILRVAKAGIMGNISAEVYWEFFFFIPNKYLLFNQEESAEQ